MAPARLATFSMIAMIALDRNDQALVTSLATLKPIGVAAALTSYMGRIEAYILITPMEDSTTETLPKAADAQKMAMICALV